MGTWLLQRLRNIIEESTNCYLYLKKENIPKRSNPKEKKGKGREKEKKEKERKEKKYKKRGLKVPL